MKHKHTKSHFSTVGKTETRAPSSERTQTPLDLLFEVVPSLQRTYLRNDINSQKTIRRSISEATQLASQRISTINRSNQSEYFSSIQPFDADKTKKFKTSLPFYQEIQQKVETYSRLCNRNQQKGIENNTKFTMKDFFTAENRDGIGKTNNDSQQQEQNTSQIGLRRQIMIRDIETISKEQLLIECGKVKQNIIDEITNLNLANLPNLYESFLIEVVKTKNSLHLAYCLYFCGAISAKFQNYQLAIYFLDQCKIICNLNLEVLTRLKLRCLLFLGLCARDLLITEKAIKIFKKALQYSWYLKERNIETSLYDHIGICYYYLGQLEKSNNQFKEFFRGKIYKEKSIKSLNQTHFTSLKQLSNEYIKETINKCHEIPFPDKVTQTLLFQMNLPFITRQGHPGTKTETDVRVVKKLKKVGTYNELFKSQKIVLNSKFRLNAFVKKNYSDSESRHLIHMRLNPQKIIERLIQDKEYQDFNIQTPPDSESENNPFNIKERGKFHHEKKTSFGDKNWNPGPVDSRKQEAYKKNPKIFKMTLEQKIKYRQEQMQDLDNDQSQNIIVSSLNQQICMSHLSLDRGQYQVSGGYTVTELSKVIEQQYMHLLKGLKDV